MTFSIVGRCEKTGALGVAVSTARIAVGTRVPFVEAGIGAVATQAETNIFLGYESLRLLRNGEKPSSVMKQVLNADTNRESRQLAIIDYLGNKGVFTGSNTIDYKGHLVGKDCIVAGNMLAGLQTLQDMLSAFEETSGFLGERLMRALEAGQIAGGDKRGKISAAIKVVKESPHPYIDLRVDEHPDPVKELRRIYNEYLRVMNLDI